MCDNWWYANDIDIHTHFSKLIFRSHFVTIIVRNHTWFKAHFRSIHPSISIVSISFTIQNNSEITSELRRLVNIEPKKSRTSFRIKAFLQLQITIFRLKLESHPFHSPKRTSPTPRKAALSKRGPFCGSPTASKLPKVDAAKPPRPRRGRRSPSPGISLSLMIFYYLRRQTSFVMFWSSYVSRESTRCRKNGGGSMWRIGGVWKCLRFFSVIWVASWFPFNLFWNVDQQFPIDPVYKQLLYVNDLDLTSPIWECRFWSDLKNRENFYWFDLPFSSYRYINKISIVLLNGYPILFGCETTGPFHIYLRQIIKYYKNNQVIQAYSPLQSKRVKIKL